MNDTLRDARPEATAFIAQVRSRLSDLSDDDREDLLGGLEADLDEKLADGAPLGDPSAYAVELRLAAGLPEHPRRRRRPTLPTTGSVTRWLDAGRHRFLTLATSRARGPWELLVALRPVWWVARAWVAVTLLDRWTGPWEPISVLPSFGVPLAGWALLAMAVVVSTLVGLGRLWPGSGPERRASARVALLAVNVAALVVPTTWGVAGPGYLAGQPSMEVYTSGVRDGAAQPGLWVDGRAVRNVFAYDAAGQPLEGVQLFDQAGRPIRVLADGLCPVEVDGGRLVANVFPRPLRTRDEQGACRAGRPVLPGHPLASVPPVTDRDAALESRREDRPGGARRQD